MADTREHVTMAVQLRGPVRTEVLMGREFRVVPATLVKSKVLHNNLGRTWLPPEEVTQQWAETFNGTPVIIDHPSQRGHPVSARDPNVLNASGVGFTFRSRAENGAVRADVFFDSARTADVPALKTIFNRLDAGQPIEGSTGFPLRALEETPGAINGEPYDRILRPAPSDHFAVFADDKLGACSVKDGCGLGVNHAGPCDTESAVEEHETVDEKTAGKLTEALNAFMAFFRGNEKPAPAADDGDNNSDEGESMNREKLVAQLAAAGPLDKEALNKLSDCQLRALAGAGAENESAEDTETVAMLQSRIVELRRENDTLRSTTATAVAAEKKERQQKIEDLIYNGNTPFSDAELNEKPIDEIRKLWKMRFEAADYSGRGAPRASNGFARERIARPILGGTGSDSVLVKEAN